jgi:hypothetical protein
MLPNQLHFVSYAITRICASSVLIGRRNFTSVLIGQWDDTIGLYVAEERGNQLRLKLGDGSFTQGGSSWSHHQDSDALQNRGQQIKENEKQNFFLYFYALN